MKNILFLVVVLTVFSVSAQKSIRNYYFICGNDTTFCKMLEYDCGSTGNIYRLKYTTPDDQIVKIKKGKEMPDISTFYIHGKTFDRVPITPKNPHGTTRYVERVINGTLVVYYSEQEHKDVNRYNPSSPLANSDGMEIGSQPVGSSHYLIKLPDGTFYKVNKKNLKNVIQPFLMQCEKFTTKYTGPFSVKQIYFFDMIRTYNECCK